RENHPWSSTTGILSNNRCVIGRSFVGKACEHPTAHFSPRGRGRRTGAGRRGAAEARSSSPRGFPLPSTLPTRRRRRNQDAFRRRPCNVERWGWLLVPVDSVGEDGRRLDQAGDRHMPVQLSGGRILVAAVAVGGERVDLVR